MSEIQMQFTDAAAQARQSVESLTVLVTKAALGAKGTHEVLEDLSGSLADLPKTVADLAQLASRAVAEVEARRDQLTQHATELADHAARAIADAEAQIAHATARAEAMEQRVKDAEARLADATQKYETMKTQAKALLEK